MKKNASKANFKQPNPAKKSTKMPGAQKAKAVGPKLTKFKAGKNVAPPKKIRSIAQIDAFRKSKYGF